MDHTKLFALSPLYIILAACGGGGGGSDSTQPTEPEPEVEITNGGSISDPTPIDYYNQNSIQAEEYFNHYEVSVSAEDTLIISSTINGVIGETDDRRCIEREDYYTGIRILNAPGSLLGYNQRSCSPYFYHTFEETGVYTIKLGFPSLTGTFVATLLPAGKEPQIGPHIATGGLPDNLGRISLDEQNSLSAHPVTNHFGYEGKAGETIYLQAYVNPKEDATTERRCIEFSHDYDGKYTFGWSVISVASSSGYGLKPRFNCSGNLSYTFPEDGTYHFNFRSFVGGTGYFYATTTPSEL